MCGCSTAAYAHGEALMVPMVVVRGRARISRFFPLSRAKSRSLTARWVLLHFSPSSIQVSEFDTIAASVSFLWVDWTIMLQVGISQNKETHSLNKCTFMMKENKVYIYYILYITYIIYTVYIDHTQLRLLQCLLLNIKLRGLTKDAARPHLPADKPMGNNCSKTKTSDLHPVMECN